MKLFNEYIQENSYTPQLNIEDVKLYINEQLDSSILFIDNKEQIIDTIIQVIESASIINLNESVNSDIILDDKYISTMYEEVESKLREELKKDSELSKLEEGIFSKIIGGATGFIIGPWIGKIIAKCLGIEKGILYDLFTSRLFNASVGAAIGNNIGK